MAAIPRAGEQGRHQDPGALKARPGGPGTQTPQGQLTPSSGSREDPGSGLDCLGKCCCLSVLRSLRTHSEPTSGSSQDAGGRGVSPIGAVGWKDHCQGEGRLRPAVKEAEGSFATAPAGCLQRHHGGRSQSRRPKGRRAPALAAQSRVENRLV